MGYLGTKMTEGKLMLLPILSHEFGFGKLWQINRNCLVSWTYTMKKFPHCSPSWVTIVNHWSTTTLTHQSPTFCPQRALLLIYKALFLTRSSDYSHIMHGNEWGLVFAKIRKAAISLITTASLPVRLSARNSAPIGQILITFDIWGFLEYLSRKFKFH